MHIMVIADKSQAHLKLLVRYHHLYVVCDSYGGTSALDITASRTIINASPNNYATRPQ